MAGRMAVGTAVGLLALTHPLAAQYRFLGNLQSYTRTPSGVDARCAPGATLHLRFLAPDLLRVTLQRPEQREPLLDWPIVKSAWGPVTVRITEDAEQLVLRTDSLTARLARTPCRLTVRDARGAIVTQDDAGMGIGWDGSEVRVWKTIAPDEHFFGLGEKTGDVDKRGREWVMWNSDNYAYTPDLDPLYQSIPFVIGVRGGRAYGIYLNNSARTVFNLGAGNHRYYSLAADRGPLDYFVIHGPSIARVVERYTELTGRMPMPPRWALGYQQSRWSYYPQAEVLRIARTFREKRIPADVLYLDIHYMDGYRVFTWDRERFPDPDGMLRELEAMGFKTVVIIDPGVKADTTTGYPVARAGLRGKHFVRYPDGEIYVGSVWPGRSYFPDFSRPETRAWWGGYLHALIAQGVDGIWDDMNEPAVWGKAFPLEVLMDDGGRRSSQKRMHNLYGFLMAKAAYEELRRTDPAHRPFVLTRAGFSGVQRYAAVWTGDNVASWEHLALAVRMMLGLGLSGYAFNGTDVGGFVGTPSPELYARWIEVGTFSPLFRTHTAANTPSQEPWSFGEQVEEISRRYIALRYRLLPYLYTLFWEAHRTGSPILRPLFWHFQQDSLAYQPEWQHEFLVGDRLLAAPVVREGQTTQRVYLPAGRWLDLATDSVYTGGRVVTVDAPLDRLPMFLGAGGILPMQEVVQHTEERPAGPLTVEVFPGMAGGRFDLYEDDGRSHEYERGAYRITRFEVQGGEAGSEIVVRREVRHDGYAPAARMLRFRIRAVDAVPSAVRLDGRVMRASDEASAEGWSYDAGRRILTVRVHERGVRQEVRIQ